ncbi:MAG: efflux RND transporter periplasmic adaptor subunit [Bryobacteraceae bacterium]
MPRSGGKRRYVWALAAAFLAAAGSGAWAYIHYGRVTIDPSIPSAIVRKGEFFVIVSCRGELVAGRSVQITAPLNVPDMRIAWQAPPGSTVKKGDSILRFDSSGAKRQLQEKEASLQQSEASLKQTAAQAAIQEEQDKLELAWQKHQVERARLEVRKAELVSKLQAEESGINLSLAEDKLNVVQATLELNKASGRSKIAAVEAERDKNFADVELTRKRIGQMEVSAPSDGMVSYLLNYSRGWMNAQPFRVGDNVWPGSAIAEIPDLASLEMKAKVEEIERSRIKLGQTARIHLDPFPEKPFPAKLASISPLTEQNFEWPPTRNFRAFGTFDAMDPRLRPGMNGRMDIVVDRIPDALAVPAKAVFARQGKPVVLVAGRDGFHAAFVEIVARNPDEVAIRGVASGDRVALIDQSGPSPAKSGKK